MRLENWSIRLGGCRYTAPECQSSHVKGEVFGSPHFPDGEVVHTSNIVRIKGHRVHTCNSTYILGKPNPAYVEWCRENGVHILIPEEPIKVKVTKEQIAEWVRNLGSDNVRDVEPITLTIGKQSWEGAVYTLRGRRWFYLHGELPKSYGPGPKTCYRFPEDDTDWFIAGYMDNYDNLNDFQQAFYPFGNHWTMKAWSVGDMEIDRHRSKDQKYRRVEVTIT